MQHYTKDEPSTIKTLFNTIADRYDLANQLMSFGLHNLWNKKLVDGVVYRMPQSTPLTVLDLCAGTGDIAFRFPSRKEVVIDSLHLLDFSKEMLAVAKLKAPKVSSRIFFHEGDAQDVPFKDASFDAITLAYGIRNVGDPKKCLLEGRRVLKNGGVMAILELTRPKNSFLQLFHKFFLHTCIPLIGKIITSDEQAYAYLKNSVLTFLGPQELVKMASSVGFTNIQVQPVAGGIATIFYFQ